MNYTEALDENDQLRVLEDAWCEFCQNYGHRIKDCPWYNCDCDEEDCQ